MAKDKIKARIGMVNFINTAPLFEVWQRSVNRSDWRIAEKVPAELNRMLRAGELDLGFISSHEYAVNPAVYRILSGLSISATGPVGSVYLFSTLPPEKLSGRRIILSSQSRTSAYLLRIILEEFYRVEPVFTEGEIGDHLDGSGDFSGLMAIGDEALRLNLTGRFPVKLDLGELWYRHTGLPFVYAVWAVREEFFLGAADTVHEIHRELLRCIDQGSKELRTISSLVAPRIPMPAEQCYNYLQNIEYDLNEQKQLGLRLFCEYLSARGEGSRESLPLKIYHN